MRADARGLSGILTASTPTDFTKRRAFNLFANVDAFRRNDLHHGHEFAAQPACAQLASVLPVATDRQLRVGSTAGHLRSARSCARASPTRRADFITRMCSGVVPQHPPTRRTPAATNLRA